MPSTYSGRHAKQGSCQSLRHSTGSFKATLRQAAQLSAQPASHANATMQTQRFSKDAKHSTKASEVPVKDKAVKEPQGLSMKVKAKPTAPASKALSSSTGPAVHAMSTHAVDHSQPAKPAQSTPSRLAADPGAAHDLASNADAVSGQSQQDKASPWSSKSPAGQLSALERMLQALPERVTTRSSSRLEQVCLCVTNPCPHVR